MRGGIGWRRAPGVNLGRLFCWLSTRGATWVHGGRWCPAESRKSSLCASNVLSQAVCVSSLCASNVLSQAVCVSSLCASNVLSQANRDGGRIRTRRFVPDRLFCWLLTRHATGEQRTRCPRAKSRYARRNKAEGARRLVLDRLFGWLSTRHATEEQTTCCLGLFRPVFSRVRRQKSTRSENEQVGWSSVVFFCWLLSRRATGEQRKRCRRAESRYARRN